jgi:FkbM family methyltransferase
MIFIDRIINIINSLKGNTAIPVEEKKVFQLLKKDIKVVFDIGVRDEVSFEELHPKAEYHLFEPNKLFIGQLKAKLKNLDCKNLKLNEYGMSDVSSDNNVYYEKSQSFMINPTIGGDTDTGIRFSLKTVDWYTKKNKIPKIDFLKIDTEGFDYKVLLGSKNSLKNVRYIQFEYWDGIQKFENLLSKKFDLYLMMEPRLLRAIKPVVWKYLSKEERKIDFQRLIIPVNKSLLSVIDNKCIPQGCGGNVLAVNKKVPFSHSKLSSIKVT